MDKTTVPRAKRSRSTLAIGTTCLLAMLASASHQNIERVDETQEGVDEHKIDDQICGASVLEFGDGEGFACLTLRPCLFAQSRHEHHQTKPDGPHEPVKGLRHHGRPRVTIGVPSANGPSCEGDEYDNPSRPKQALPVALVARKVPCPLLSLEFVGMLSPRIATKSRPPVPMQERDGGEVQRWEQCPCETQPSDDPLVQGSMRSPLHKAMTGHRWIERALAVGRNEGMKGWTSRTWRPASMQRFQSPSRAPYAFRS